ncbi:hypothetical protein KBZ07_11905 [Cyanobium sp. BA20m-14]|uniref:hypothetical protein n=1 Tax=Cyanobium sp. BA20m-14 TaxID=2823703 RepID=UPI0020CCB142|nr:hypothetical protein [Cyanobium sp. BA20m-14]MCP9914095.1 hypothetical protein [Cyanobium sp. BA20m-14]
MFSSPEFGLIASWHHNQKKEPPSQLSGSTLRVSLGELAGGKRVRLQLVEESPEQLPPPPLP